MLLINVIEEFAHRMQKVTHYYKT